MDYRNYWEVNIVSWGEYYLDISHGHEKLNGPDWFVWLYTKTISQIERKLMKKRYCLTIEFLDEFVTSDENFLDLGCGTGIFTTYALGLGANVTAVDFTEAAIIETQRRINEVFPQSKSISNNFTLIKADINSESFLHHNTCLLVGVLPYIEDARRIFSEVLAKQDTSLIQYIDSTNLFNRLRKKFHFLNVRKLQMLSTSQVDTWSHEFGLKVLRRTRIGTGYLDILVKNDSE
jgi:SAM-dependent methyltransferase